MGQSAVKNPKKIFSQAGADPALNNRVTNLENNEYKILYFQTISSATGTITKPTGSTILLDQFYSGGDALVETLSNGQPTGQSPLTIGGTVVSVTSFDISGNYVLSGTPSAYPVALVYIFKIKAIDLPNLNMTNIMQMDANGYVPYVGAITDLDLGEYQIKVGQIELDQSPTGTAGVTVTRWNNTSGITETTLKGGSVVLKNGVDLVARVVNKVSPNTTLTKAAYQVVKVSGAQGQRLAVDFAQGDIDLNSADTLGVVTETIPTNQEGFILTVGQLEGINTTGSLQSETWVDGDVLYLSPTIPGAMTNIKPTGLTGHIVVLGYVEYAHINNGKIYIKIMNGWELDELHNVYINQATLTNNDVLTYESSSQLWKNKQVKDTIQMCIFSASFNPADATTYYFSRAIPTTTASNHAIKLGYNGTITSAIIIISNNTVSGSTESSSIQFRNITQATSSLISNTVKTNASTTSITTQTVTGLNIPFLATDDFCLEFNAATFVTNPTVMFLTIYLTIEKTS